MQFRRLGEAVGVAGVAVTEGIRVGVADTMGVSCKGGFVGLGGFKLHAERSISASIKKRYRITRSLLTLGPSGFYCTLTMLRKWNMAFPI